jgi:hypothetical protein
MKIAFIFLFFLISSANLCSSSTKQESTNLKPSANDSIYTALLINHLRNNFDDIHDVSMRFHHLDHNLNGVIQIRMHWENGYMTASSVALNETNNVEFANALINNIEKWYIQDLTGPFDIVLPIRIKIVGSGDSTFFKKGILTGEVYDNGKNPIKYAKITFRSSNNANDTLRSCYSNREGIFVKTLIPVGSWKVECDAPGFQKVVLENITFAEGEHLRKKIEMIKIK